MWSVPRKHERIPVSLEVVWEASSGKHDARMSDISMGGCYIDSIGPATIGEAIVFKVHLPTGHWIQLRGEVAHQFPNVGLGLRFTNLTEEEQILIEQVILAHGGESSAHQSGVTQSEAKTGDQTSQLHRYVLVADDDPTIRHLVKVIVQKEGYPVVTAHDGREVFHILQSRNDFLAAIFDMVMPHIQGLDLVRHMKTTDRLQHIPVGIMTAEQDPKLWHDSFAAGAGIFLPKPFTASQMQFMLRVLLSQRQV